MDRNKILTDLICDYETYSQTDTRPTIEKVLKFSGGESDIRERGDFSREAVFLRYSSANTDYLLRDEKPDELVQEWEALIYVKQDDKHSTKEIRRDRILEISDQIIDWSLQVSACDVNTDLYTITFSSIDATVEEDGYLSTTLTFTSIIKLQ